MKRFSFFTSLTLVAFIAATAQAGVIVNITPVVVGSGFGNPEAALTGFSSFAVTVSTTEAGEVISAIDAEFLGPLHQRWFDTDFDFVGDPSPSTPSLAGNNRGDSSLTAAGKLIGSAPAEDNTGVGSPLPGAPPSQVYGLGTFLRGAWGIDGQFQSNTEEVAYIVLPDSQLSDFSFEIATSLETVTVGGTIGIPEPGTLVLGSLALIGIALGRRRS